MAETKNILQYLVNALPAWMVGQQKVAQKPEVAAIIPAEFSTTKLSDEDYAIYVGAMVPSAGISGATQATMPSGSKPAVVALPAKPNDHTP